MAERLTYRRVLPFDVPVSTHNVAENFHAWWIMMTAMSVSEALMMMLLAFPTSSMTLAWRQMRVSASAWLQPSTSMVSCLTIFNVEVATFDKMANIHMAVVYDVCVCLLLPFIQ